MRAIALQLSHDFRAKAINHAVAAQRNQTDFAGLAGFETDGGAGRDIKPHAARREPIELQGGVGFRKMIMAADLNGPIPRIRNHQCEPRQPGVELDVAGKSENFAGDHRIGACTVTSFVPSGKVASTWISSIISATPSITCSRVRTRPPASMRSATLLPSRAPSRTKSVINATASG